MTTEAQPGAKLEKIVNAYITLRDEKARRKSEYEKQVAELDSAMERIENYFLKHLQDSGSESVRTKAGTFYKQERISATVADWDMVLDFIRQGEHWSMLERRVNKTFVESYKAEYHDIPPGVNLRSELVVNVRRS